MDFFDQQDRARKRSHLLIFYFLAAVIGIVIALYLAVSIGLFFAFADTPGGGGFRFLHPVRFGVVAVATAAVVGLATFFKVLQLRQGGGVVARSVGGRRVHADTRDFHERQLLNVVEEMAIASGTPMPEVYILDHENAINAFAAGFSPNDAAVAVTRGTLERLSRDELQGVMAHEFSHILNGDMRLNIKLAGVLFGILVLAMTGRILLHSMRFSGGRRSSGSGKGGGGLIIAIILTAVALFVIGYIGVFFGRLIQAAVSRQREYLADAAAVQFTRNPQGIAGALKKIGGLQSHSAIGNGKASNLAHMCFGSIEKKEAAFFSLATHPPLVERIKAIDPGFDGKFPSVPTEIASAPRGEAASRRQSAEPPPIPVRSDSRDRFQVGVANLAGTVGLLGAAQMETARRQLDAIPEKIRQARDDTAGARAVILALVFDRDPQSLFQQMEIVEGEAAPDVARMIQETALEVRKLPRELRFPTLESVIPALYTLPPEDYRRFARVLDRCIQSDGKVELLEFVVQRLVRKQVEPRIFRDKVDRSSVKFHSLHPLRGAIAQLLSAVAEQTASTPSASQERFEAASKQFPELSPLSPVAAGTTDFGLVDAALDRLAHAAFPIRRRFLAACSDMIMQDGTVTVDEHEWLRLLAVSLDCPMPPLDADAGKA